jgi:regulatory protein
VVALEPIELWYSMRMRITALQPQRNNPERINVFVDGRFQLGVDASLIYEMKLAVDQDITPAQLEQLRHAEALQQTVDRTLNFLSFRPRSRTEIHQYLRRKNTPPELIEAVLERLDQLELVNDRDFASFWIENRDQFNPRGAQALRHELRAKGVTHEVIDELVDNETDEERALQAGRKKAASLLTQQGMDYATFYRRLGSYLQRRGFQFDSIRKATKTLWEDLRKEV